MNKTQQTWDLSDLFTGPDDPALEDAFEEILSKSRKFQIAYQGTLNSNDVSPEHLRQALDAYESLITLEQKPVAYAYLLYTTSTGNAETKTLLKQSQDIRATFRKHTVFFVSEINNIPEEHFQKLINDPCLKIYVRFLKKQRIANQHLLSEKEEALLAATESCRKKAWSELYLELRANTSGDRLPEMEPAIVQICNALLSEKRTVDELRNYETPLSEFALQNEIPLPVIDKVVKACLDNREIPEKFIAIKRRTLNQDKLPYSDRHRPIFEHADKLSFEDAKKIVLEAFDSFSPEFSRLANIFFTSNWIDPFPRPGKAKWSSTESITPDHHPYIFLNFSGRPVDIVALAHELGHGIHFLLSKNNHLLDFRVSPVLAETAGIFAEMILFHHLTSGTRSSEQYSMWLSRRLDDLHARIFDCLTTFLFQKKAHEAAKSTPNLKAHDLRRIWMETLKDVWGTTFVLEENQAQRWFYQSSMFKIPFYTFTYVFGELVTQSLYVKWLEEGTRFVDKYISLLESGGSKNPEDLLNMVDISIHSPTTWEDGISAVKGLIAKLDETVDTWIRTAPFRLV